VNVPVNNSKKNPYRALGRWVASIRYSKKREEEKAQNGMVEEEKKRGGHTYEILSPEQIKLLDSIGFDWTLTMLKRSQKKLSFTNDDEVGEQMVFNDSER